MIRGTVRAVRLAGLLAAFALVGGMVSGCGSSSPASNATVATTSSSASSSSGTSSGSGGASEPRGTVLGATVTLPAGNWTEQRSNDSADGTRKALWELPGPAASGGTASNGAGAGSGASGAAGAQQAVMLCRVLLIVQPHSSATLASQRVQLQGMAGSMLTLLENDPDVPAGVQGLRGELHGPASGSTQAPFLTRTRDWITSGGTLISLAVTGPRPATSSCNPVTIAGSLRWNGTEAASS